MDLIQDPYRVGTLRIRYPGSLESSQRKLAKLELRNRVPEPNDGFRESGTAS